MNGRNGLLILTATLGLGLLIVGCVQTQSTQGGDLSDPWGVVAVASGRPISIGLALSNMDSKSDGAELARGAELSIRHHQSVAGFALETVPITTGCSVEEAQAAASKVTENEALVAVIGPDCSAACQSLTPLLEDVHFTAISPACAASSLSDPVAHLEAFLRTFYTDALEGSIAAQFAYRELGARRIAIIDDGTIETEDAASAFETRMAGLGGKIVARASMAPGETNIEEILSDIESQEPDLIYAPLTAEDAAMLVTRRQETENLADVTLLGGRHYWNEGFLGATSQAAEGVYAVGPYISTPLLDQANASYQALYNQAPPSLSYAYAYDAVSILVEALKKVAVRGSQGRLLIGRKALQEAIYSTANYPGLTGSLTCTNWGDCGAASVAVGQVKDGKWVTTYIP